MERLEKVTTAQTTTYKTDYDGFLVDIVKVDDGWGYAWEAWLYHKDYGVKSFIFGTTYTGTEQGFVYATMEGIEEDIERYKEKYFDEEDK